MLGPEIDPQRIVMLIVTFVVAIAVHEFMHAWTASKLGDQTARNLGRVTLNPVVHFDPIGFFLLILVAIGIAPITWGKPVPVNTYNLRPLGPLGRNGSMAVVALAGPASNVVMAAIAALPLRFGDLMFGLDPAVLSFLDLFITMNLLLAAFNMIPIPPLDGSKVLMGILPRFWTPVLAPLERFGFMILLVILIIGEPGRLLLNAMIRPVFELLTNIVYPV